MDDVQLVNVMADLIVAASIVPIQLPACVGEGGRYELQELLSISDRSHVYLAIDRVFHHEGQDAKVIVKVTQLAHRGVLEALTARHIGSPFVVRVLDRGQLETGEHFLVLEHAPLGDLGAQRVPWEPRKAALFMAQLASAVQAAHSAGLVHCDLKPGNVLVTERGEPRLTDFDLSTRVVDGAGVSSRGNRAFSAPEQFRGEDGAFTPRADIYALGGLLYYLLSGEISNGSTPEDVAALHLGQRVRKKLVAPPELAYVSERALSPNKVDRYDTAEQFEADLTAYLEKRPLPSRPVGVVEHTRKWCLRHPGRAVAVVAMCMGIVVGIGAVWFWQAEQHAKQLKIAEEATRLTQEELDRHKVRLATQFESIAYSLRVLTATGSSERINAGLHLVQMLDRVPFDTEEKSVSTVEHQRGMLERIIQTGVEQGRSDHFDVQVARLMLSMILMRETEWERALNVSSEANARWGNRLVAGEAVELAQRFTQLLPGAFLEIRDGRGAGGLSAETKSRLNALRAELARGGSRESMVWVVDQALAGKILKPSGGTAE